MNNSFIDAFIDAAENAANTPVVIASRTRPADSTLHEILIAGRHMGTRLMASGVQPGDVVALMLPNWREWLVVAVAAAQSGAVLLPIVTIYGAKELGFILRQSGARWLFTPEFLNGVDYRHVVKECGELPLLDRHIMVGDEFEQLERKCPIEPAVKTDPDALALLVYTSGTTADPKGVMHSANTLLSELHSIKKMRSAAGGEVAFSPWPPGHVAGALSMFRFLAMGMPLVLMDHWDATLAAQLVEKYKITSSSGTPFHLSGMIEAAEKQGCDLSSLRQYLVGAAPVPPSLVEKCIDQNLAVYHCYGSSEHPTVTSGTADDPLDKQLHSEGRVIAGSEMRFVDDDGNDVPHGVDGEICTRGPELFIGYWDDRLNEEAFFPGGWYRTGDVGRLDDDGYLLITDRKKDIIIRGGENISSKEVEAVLLRHKAIADTAVVAAPDERMGEVVRACVVLTPNASLTIEDIKSHFEAAGIAKQKTPERLTVLEELPRNASGKV